MDGVDYKVCSICNKNKPLDDYYSRKAYNKTMGDYIYYNPYCKKCTSDKFAKWRKNNPEKDRITALRYEEVSRDKDKVRENNRKSREKGVFRKWQQDNKDKLLVYQQNRMSKKHNIPEKEWLRCKEYFEFSCAYCGLPEIIHRELYRQQLHKEHVVRDGRDDIKNCVPACKSCNGSKHVKTLNEWYNSTNMTYSTERYTKIYQWIRYDSKLKSSA